MAGAAFPDGLYVDVPGLCKAVTRKVIVDNDYSLTPGRYVGVDLKEAQTLIKRAGAIRLTVRD